MSAWRRSLRIAIIASLLLALGGYVANRLGFFSTFISAAVPAAETPELRGAWVQAKSITSQEKVDEMLRRAEAGHFNAIFVNVFAYGQALYESDLVRKYEKVEPDFNPLAYLVEEAHRRNIAVHAWFVSGPVGHGKGKGSAILTEHPDWSLVGPDGGASFWLNYTRPDVRQFISNLMLETVEKYHVDGLHFDYTRYPGPEWGFDAYSIETFTTEHNYDLNQLRYADLPAYGLFEGNPLTRPDSAQVLAAFANGLPAVALNSYGEGEVVLLNWDANSRQVAAGGEILQRSLQRLADEGGRVYLFRSETNAEQYSYDGFDRGAAWLEQLGWTPLAATEANIQHLRTDSVLVLPNVYLISPQTATHLADFVAAGGGIIFIDGPTKSIHLEEIRAMTGMQARGRHFNELMLMRASVEHALIPMSDRAASLETYQLWDARWKEFRKRGINNLIENVYRRVKSEHPHVAVSVTITAKQDKADQQVFQDWPAWLAGGYVDFIVPRGYVVQAPELIPVIAAWQPAIQDYDQIILGVKAFTGKHDARSPKSPAQLLTEIDMVRAGGSNGVILFDLDNMSVEQLAALASDAFP